MVKKHPHSCFRAQLPITHIGIELVSRRRFRTMDPAASQRHVKRGELCAEPETLFRNLPKLSQTDFKCLLPAKPRQPEEGMIGVWVDAINIC